MQGVTRDGVMSRLVSVPGILVLLSFVVFPAGAVHHTTPLLPPRRPVAWLAVSTSSRLSVDVLCINFTPGFGFTFQPFFFFFLNLALISLPFLLCTLFTLS